MEKGTNLGILKEKYNLHKSAEVQAAAAWTEGKTQERIVTKIAKHEKNPIPFDVMTVDRVAKSSRDKKKRVPQDPHAQIQNYLDRLERVIFDPARLQTQRDVQNGKGKRPRALSLLRDMVMNAYVRPNREKMTQAAVRVEEIAAADMGVEAEYTDEARDQRGDVAIKDVESSLDQWINYLSDPNEPYPMWFRYYAFRNILDLTDYDKDKQEFPKRSANTIRLFPDIDRGALAFVQERIDAGKNPEILERIKAVQVEAGTPVALQFTKQKAEVFARLSFAKQYELGMKEAGEITPELRAETRGIWKTYTKGSEPTALWASLQNKGTAWCTKGFGTAQTQLQGGDFYVYYTLDKSGKPTIPRLAIRMNGDEIGEIRGVADNEQNVEENLVEIADIKMNTLPGAEQFREASHDTRLLKALFKKTTAKEALTKDELKFLYEIDRPIVGFGYQKHPRIAELRLARAGVLKDDIELLLGIPKPQIAQSIGEVTNATRMYIGSLERGIFQRLPETVQDIRTTFPEGRVYREQIEIGGKTVAQLEAAMKEAGFRVDDNGLLASEDFKKSIYEPPTFTQLKSPEQIDLVRLTVADLGFPKGATTQEIFDKAIALGLELCPPEVGPYYRLQYTNQPMHEWIRVGMKPIIGRGGNPRVFVVYRVGDGAWLSGNWALPMDEWNADSQFMFRIRKLEA
jgi:hypothetical protein